MTHAAATLARSPIVLCELAATGIDGLESHSPFCLKVHRALRLAGLEYTSRHGQQPSDFRHLNPAAQVPVLLVGSEVVCDSTRILARIEALVPGAFGRLDGARAAEAWLLEEFADSALNGFLVAARWADPRNWPRVRDAYFGRAPWFVRALIAPRIRKGVMSKLVSAGVLRAGEPATWREFGRVLDLLERRAPLAGFWLGTEGPSVADLAIFAQLHSLRTELTPWQARELTLRPALTDWLDRVDEATRAVPGVVAAPVRNEVTPASFRREGLAHATSC